MFEYSETTKKILAEIDNQHKNALEAVFNTASKQITSNTTFSYEDLIKVEQEMEKVSSKFLKQKYHFISMSAQYFIVVNPSEGLITTPTS